LFFQNSLKKKEQGEGRKKKRKEKKTMEKGKEKLSQYLSVL